MADPFGKYDVYSVASSIYCYPDSSVLKNKLDIRDPVLLRKVEADLSSARQAEIFHIPVAGRFTATHLCNIHRKLLGDVYSFAGHFRREDIAKGPTRFVTYSQIKEKLQRLLGQLQQEKWLENVPFEAFAARSAYYMAELNYIHPFREGNGRAIREFMRLLFLHNGYVVQWDAVDVEALLNAMIDSVYDTAHLEQILKQCLVASPDSR
ncbi:MAG: Fic family protein [Bacteroidaceae bacterium]|nr:Fic family protein [Bacteroidaceae bacterium]